LSFDLTQFKLKIGQKNSRRYKLDAMNAVKQMTMNDYNANVDFDINRKCLVEPTGCIVTHTHTNPDVSNHTFISDWDFDEYNHQFTHNQ